MLEQSDWQALVEVDMGNAPVTALSEVTKTPLLAGQEGRFVGATEGVCVGACAWHGWYKKETHTQGKRRPAVLKQAFRHIRVQ